MSKLLKSAKDTIKLGVVSNVGLYGMGALGKLPGMPAQANTVTSVAGAGLTLANTGQLLKTTSVLTSTLNTKTSVKSSKTNDVVKKILRR